MTFDPLDQFRRDAKTLKSRYETGHPMALKRIEAAAPRKGGADLKHADYLHVIARENAFASWPTMKAAIEDHGLDRAAKIQRLKIALHHGQTGVVDRLITADPDLAAGHFGLLCALYDLEAVGAMLARDATLAARKAGPSSPLVQLCRSRMFTVWPDKSDAAIKIGAALVEHGADVNDHSTEDSTPLSPLYWALGHAGHMPLARWLLENGAKPDDGESLYHATELGNAEGLRLLLEFGASPAGTNALLRALDFDNLEMVTLLLAAGADPNKQNGGAQPALHHAARRMVSGPILDALLDHGADPALTWQGHSGYAFAQVFGNTDMVGRMTERGHDTLLTDLEMMLATAATGQMPDGYLDPAKLPAAYANLLHDVLHLSGKLPHLRALVAIGMEWDRPDDAGVTPVQAAGWNGLPDVMAFFLNLSPNLGHVNAYGGTLLSTILHGAEANPTRAQGDYVGCLRLALEHGVALPRRAIHATGRSDITAFLQDWAEAKPGQVVEHGVV